MMLKSGRIRIRISFQLRGLRRKRKIVEVL